MIFLVIMAMMGSFILGLAIVIFYARYRQQQIKQASLLQQMELAHQKKLLYTMIESQEEERQRIGRDLHDGVGASLSQLNTLIHQEMDNNNSQEHTTSNKQSCFRLLDSIEQDTRHIAHLLSPPTLELFGLEEALYELGENISRVNNLPVNIQSRLTHSFAAVSKATQLSLFRVLQELLTNTIKHAQAQKITIDMSESTDAWLFVYTDDGKGLPGKKDRKGGMGLFNIESRLSMISATYTITSPPGSGMQVSISIPLMHPLN
jgi:signal transduction histidine kinase